MEKGKVRGIRLRSRARYLARARGGLPLAGAGRGETPQINELDFDVASACGLSLFSLLSPPTFLILPRARALKSDLAASSRFSSN